MKYLPTREKVRSTSRGTRAVIRGKQGKLVDKGYLCKLLNNRVYVGEAVHKGTPYPGEHQAIIERTLWDRVHDTHASIAEIATAEKINESYVGRILRLTLLAPEIVESILNGTQPASITLHALMRSFPLQWEQQINLERQQR